MTLRVRYGLDSVLELDLPDVAVVGLRAESTNGDHVDAGAATRQAVAAPIGFPPLASSVVPGDHVVLALDPAVPQAIAVVSAVVETIEQAGVERRDVTILLADEAEQRAAGGSRSISDRLIAAVGRDVRLLHHDPERREDLSYLAATESGRAVYLNRALCDADLVVPIACARSPAAVGCHAAGSAVYPLFSDAATRRRYRSPRLIEDLPEVEEQARHEIEQVTWLLGERFGVYVVPGATGEVLEVVAGEIDAAHEQAQQLHEAAWHRQLPERASLVVATIPGAPEEQTWDNVGRALAAASRIVADDGAIAVCCDLAAAPGAAIQGLVGGGDRHRVERAIKRERPDDATAALLLLDAVRRARVYLLSRVDPEVVEALDLAVVDDAADIARLASRHKSCVVLAGAQHATAETLENGAVR